MNGNRKEVEPIRRPIKALLVDDQVDVFFKPELKKQQIEAGMRGKIEFASSAQEALEILERQAKNGSLPDIVVIDFYMPEMGGLDLIREIRKSRNRRVRLLPVCVIAGLLGESEKSQLEELGVRRVLNKALLRENSHEIRWAWEESQEKEPNPQLLKVLWVDDNRSVIDFVRRVLKEKFGWEVNPFDNAEAALEALEKRAEENNLPDIIISDFSIPPGMSGLEFARIIRGHQDERIRSLLLCLACSFPFERLTDSELEEFKELEVSILDKIEAITNPQKIRQILEESKRRA